MFLQIRIERINMISPNTQTGQLINNNSCKKPIFAALLFSEKEILISKLFRQFVLIYGACSKASLNSACIVDQFEGHDI